MTLTFDQIRRYFEARLERSLQPREKVAVLCPFHNDSTPSATVFLSGNGGFNCNGCQVKGNTFQFEARFSNCDMETARKNIAEITGADLGAAGSIGHCTGVYDYRKADGSLAFQKRRYESAEGRKTFRIYRPEGNGWCDGLAEDTARVLFNLPDVITANMVLLAEGEKDCETLAQVSPWPERPGLRIATTTNFEGAWQPGQAPKWLDRYSPTFAGKVVIVFEDNDAAGRVWADHVCSSIHPFAEFVRRVTFRDMAPKSDVSDWMQQGHTVDELRKLITSAPLWKQEQSSVATISEDAITFASREITPIRWLIEDIIPAQGNGIVCGDPKASKSYHALDLSLSIACGVSWLGTRVPRPARTYLVSREDSPGMTQRRLLKLLTGNPEYAQRLGNMMRINTRRHTADFKVTNETDLHALIEDIKRFECELCMLDVFRSIHNAKENDNDEMPVVLEKVNRIQLECGCAVGLVHHLSKATPENIFMGLRGASAIHGWMEWGIGISVTNPDVEDKSQFIRKVEFENKEATHLPLYTRIVSQDADEVRIECVESPHVAKKRRPSIAEMPARRYGNDD